MSQYKYKNKKDLIKLCEERDLEYDDKLKKQDLIDILTKYDIRINKNFPNSSFYLVHSANYNVLENILKDKFLKSRKNLDPKFNKNIFIGKNKFGVSDYYSRVFFTLVVPYDENIDILTSENIFNEENDFIAFIFDPDLVKDSAACIYEIQKSNPKELMPYFTHYWSGGFYIGENTLFEYDKNLNYNLNKWRKHFIRLNPEPETMTTAFGKLPNSEIPLKYVSDDDGQCVEGKVSLEKHLKAIYVSKESKHYEKIFKLSKDYPEYNWVFG